MMLPHPVRVADVNYSTHMILVCSAEDEEGFEVPLTARRLSELLSDLIVEPDTYIIPVNNLHFEAVRCVAAWLCHYADESVTPPRARSIPKPCPSHELIPVEYLDEYEKEFCRVVLPPLDATDFRLHTTLIHAAHFLSIQDLLTLMCCTWAMRLKGKSISEVQSLTRGQSPLRTGETFRLPSLPM